MLEGLIDLSLRASCFIGINKFFFFIELLAVQNRTYERNVVTYHFILMKIEKIYCFVYIRHYVTLTCKCFYWWFERCVKLFIIQCLAHTQCISRKLVLNLNIFNASSLYKKKHFRAMYLKKKMFFLSRKVSIHNKTVIYLPVFF